MGVVALAEDDGPNAAAEPVEGADVGSDMNDLRRGEPPPSSDVFVSTGMSGSGNEGGDEGAFDLEPALPALDLGPACLSSSLSPSSSLEGKCTPLPLSAEVGEVEV